MAKKRQNKKLVYRKGIFFVVYNKNVKNVLYLLLKRKLHWKGWEFPKAGAEKKETIEKTLNRELKEETGQIASRIIKTKISGKYPYSKKVQGREGYKGQTYRLFISELKNKKIKLDKKEHSAYKWLNYKKALALLAWPNQRKCLRVANKIIGKINK